MKNIKSEFRKNAIPYIQATKNLIKENATKEVETTTIAQLYGGMRDVVCMTTETSMLDSYDGIRFRGFSLADIYTNMPSSSQGSKEPNAELIFLLLLLGRMPSTQEVDDFSQELHSKGYLPEYAKKIIDHLPKDMHPMTQFATVMSSLEKESVFAVEYKKGLKKDKYWEYIYDDAVNMLAILPFVVTYLYNHNYNDSKNIPADKSLDWAGNLAHMLGDSDNSKTSFTIEFFRLYTAVHSDHEGGNASAFTAHVVGSTLATPYAAFASAMHSLSGPLHGLAAQTSFNWIQDLIATHDGKAPTKEEVESFINQSLATGKLVPGYGHAVLRKTDPRFTVQMDFAKRHNMHNKNLETVWNVYNVAPKVLGSIGKIKNPYPNVDSHSGVILHSLGFENLEFFTVFFGISRALGILAQQVWDRAMMLPIHRPRSVTTEWVKENIINK